MNSDVNLVTGHWRSTATSWDPATALILDFSSCNSYSPHQMAKVLAVCVILIAFTINCISVKCSSRVQSVFVVAQLSSVTFVIALGVWQLTRGETRNFRHMFDVGNSSTPMDAGSIVNVGIALFGALWSYDGWSQVGSSRSKIIGGVD